MKRILVVAASGAVSAAGALGAAALITAAPASAAPGCTPDFVCDVLDQPQVFVNGIATQPQTFQQNLAGQPQRFADSINPAIQGDRFLNGDCVNYDAGKCEEGSVGVLNQPQAFLDNLASQPTTFATNLAGQPQRFIDSITTPFGPDSGFAHDDQP